MTVQAAITTEALAAMPLFRDISEADLSSVGSLLRARRLPASTNLFSVEQPGEIAYIILSGTIKVHVEQADGSDVILAILGRGEILGEMSLVDRIGRSASAATMEESMLLWLDRSTFWELIERIPALNRNLVSILSRRLRLANTRIQSLATEDVSSRIARQLLAFAREYGEPLGDGQLRIPLRLTQSDLAELVGATRVRVNQTLAALRREKQISIDENYRITVHDGRSLEAFSS
jgi:CRP/FNR family cyclic AMP-dependent transcriptional regulator